MSSSKPSHTTTEPPNFFRFFLPAGEHAFIEFLEENLIWDYRDEKRKYFLPPDVPEALPDGLAKIKAARGSLVGVKILARRRRTTSRVFGDSFEVAP